MFKKIFTTVALAGVLVVGTAHFLFWDGNPLLPQNARRIIAAQTAQYDGTAIRISQGPNNIDYATKLAYTANQVIYKGTAAKVQPTFSWTTAGGTLTNCIDATNTATCTTSTAHGLTVGSAVTLAGVTADTDLNGTYYVQTVGSTTTFTITTASVTDATYSASGIVLSTTSPRTTAAIWHITFYIYSGTDCIDIKNSDFSEIWDNRAVTTGATQITYN